MLLDGWIIRMGYEERNMKIAILDFGMSKTHRRLNIRNFEVLSKLAELYIINSGHYYDSLKTNKNIYLVETDIVTYREKYKMQGTSKFSSFLGRKIIHHNMIENRKLFKAFRNEKFDYILIMGYEIITFALFRFYFPKNIPIYIYQHQQIDELNSRIKNFFFSTFKNKVNHIVMEESFLDYLVQEVRVQNVFVVHFLNEQVQRKIDNHRTKLVLGVSSTNDEQWVKKIIEMEEKDAFLKKEHWHMRLKSQKLEYKDNYLFVDTSFFSDEEYYELFLKATAILSISPDSFRYRLSGPVLDAIATGKIIIAKKTPLIKKYEKMAPSMFRVFSNVDELKALLTEKDWIINQDELHTMQHRHSESNVLSEYGKVFCKKSK